MAIAYLGLGSNLGNRLAFLRGGRDRLAGRPDITLLRMSGVYETDAVGGATDDPPYLNTVLEIETELTPHDLLAACLAVENEFGRTRPREWAPRTLDIDLLLYSDAMIDQADLKIPHPRLHERAFALVPLSELAPKLFHPQLQKSIRALADSLPPGCTVTPLRTTW